MPFAYAEVINLQVTGTIDSVPDNGNGITGYLSELPKLGDPFSYNFSYVPSNAGYVSNGPNGGNYFGAATSASFTFGGKDYKFAFPPSLYGSDFIWSSSNTSSSINYGVSSFTSPTATTATFGSVILNGGPVGMFSGNGIPTFAPDVQSFQSATFAFRFTELGASPTNDTITGRIGKISIAPQPPINFGLFIGARDGSILFDQNALKIADVFAKQANAKAYVLTDYDINGNPISPITVAQIKAKLEFIRGQMRPGDSLTLYINDHGGGSTLANDGQERYKRGFVTNDTGVGDDLIHIGGARNPGVDGYLFDDNLADMLKQFDGFRKTIYLDSCHGGGFWGGLDSLDFAELSGYGFEDLSQLKNIALYSGATESSLEYAPVFGTGLSYWGEALISALQLNLTGKLLGDYLHDQTIENAGLYNLIHPNDPFSRELGLGDLVPTDLSLIQPFFALSADYDLNAPVESSVPEPSGIILMGVGMTCLLMCRRRTKISIFRIACDTNSRET